MPGPKAKPKAVVRKTEEVPASPVGKGNGATIRVLLGSEQGMPHFELRVFAIEPSGRIPSHRHDVLEHGQLVLEGKMILTLDGEERTVSAGDAVFIPAGVSHSYENRGKTPVRFLCAIPRAEYKTEWLEECFRASENTPG